MSVDDLDDDLTSVSELATSMLEENQLTIDPEVVDEVDPTSERTLLHTAANDGDLNLVVRLLEIGAEIERSDRNGQTALNLGKLWVCKFSILRGWKSRSFLPVSGQ